MYGVDGLHSWHWHWLVACCAVVCPELNLEETDGQVFDARLGISDKDLFEAWKAYKPSSILPQNYSSCSCCSTEDSLNDCLCGLILLV